MHLVERRGFQFNTDLFWVLPNNHIDIPEGKISKVQQPKNNKHLGYSKFYEIIGFA